VPKRSDRGNREGRCFPARPSDILSIHCYLAERSLAAADRTLVRFSQRFDELREFPFLGPDRNELRASLRGLLMDGYVAFYIVEADQIVIVRVIDGRMDIEREMSK
jgi:toxin ParE1/3/4